jgi:hypothetical protein
MLKHPDIKDLEVEPHDLWAAIDLNHFKRLKKKNSNLQWIINKIQLFKDNGSQGKWYGAKFALNPGTKALEWIWLHKTFPEAKFIFIVRNKIDTWKSVYKQDFESVRGLIRKEAYDILVDDLVNGYSRPGVMKNSCFVEYENLVMHTDEACDPIWELLNISPVSGLASDIRRPENWSVS